MERNFKKEHEIGIHITCVLNTTQTIFTWRDRIKLFYDMYEKKTCNTYNKQREKC